MRSREESLRGMHDARGEIGEQLAAATVGTKEHELLAGIHHHLGEFIRLTEELYALKLGSGG